MAMAEPRRKEKWGSDPRGSAWSKDKEKFGFKMLEKMGWAEGGGLGAKLNGRTDHVKVRNKRNNFGIGASGRDVDHNWLQTQDTFNSLLKDLNKAAGTTDGAIPTGPPKQSVMTASLASKKSSRLLMFQSRFRKAKDLSNMDSTDLAAILGGDSLRPDRMKAIQPEEKPVKSTLNEEYKNVTSELSVNDYFAKRLAQKRAGAKAAAVAEDAVAEGEAAVEKEEAKPKKKDKKRKREEAVSAGDGSDEGDAASKKKKKKKKKEKKAKQAAKAAEAAAAAAAAAAEAAAIAEKAAKKKKKSKKKSKKAK